MLHDHGISKASDWVFTGRSPFDPKKNFLKLRAAYIIVLTSLDGIPQDVKPSFGHLLVTAFVCPQTEIRDLLLCEG